MRLLKLVKVHAERAVDLTPKRYVVVRLIHPSIKSTNGYLKAGFDDYRWTSKWHNATLFKTKENAMACVAGFNIQYNHAFKIEQL
jgi:hypothetical protein